MAPFFTGIAGAIKGQAGFGFGRRATRPSRKTTVTFAGPTYTYATQPSPSSSTTTTIPTASFQVDIKCEGGGGYSSNGSDSIGGTAQGTFTTLAGKTLTVSFAGNGDALSVPSPSSFEGSRGGNYAGVFDGPVIQANSLVIAGAGGGGNGVYVISGDIPYGNTSGIPVTGGAGGGTTGSAGPTNPVVPTGYTAAQGGGGGTQSAGGAGGSSTNYPSVNAPTRNGSSGSALQGGSGGGQPYPEPQRDKGRHGSGGGGGYYGGGGGGAGGYEYATFGNQAGCGGGGSSYIHPSATDTINTQGTATAGKNGQVTIDYYEYI